MHTIRRERADARLIEELMPLFEQHYSELSHFKDIPLQVSREKYESLEKAGVLRWFIARLADGKAVGYCLFVVSESLHHDGSLQAVQDALYIHPDHRGNKGALIAFAEQELAKEGVQIVYQHIKASHNIGPMLERMGYELVDLIYGKRLSHQPVEA